MSVDDNQDLDMTEQEFDDRTARGEAVTVVNLASTVAGGNQAANRYVVTNTEPRIARSDETTTQALLTR